MIPNILDSHALKKSQEDGREGKGLVVGRHNDSKSTKGGWVYFLKMIYLQNCMIVWDGVRKLVYDIQKRTPGTS